MSKHLASDVMNSIHKYVLYFSGGLGQLGTGLAKLLRENYGTENVILSDIIKPSKEVLADGKSIY